jgi:hypothetical protein
MSAVKWLAVGVFCLALSRLADRSRHHDRHHRMRLISWRWDQIAQYRRRQSRFSRFGLRVARPIGNLTVPLTLAGTAALAAAAYAVLS